MSLSENFARATNMFCVEPGEAPNLDTRDPAWAGDEDRSEKKRKKQAGKILEDSVEELRIYRSCCTPQTRGACWLSFRHLMQRVKTVPLSM